MDNSDIDCLCGEQWSLPSRIHWPDEGQEGKGSWQDQPHIRRVVRDVWILGNESNIPLYSKVPRQGVWGVHYGHRERRSRGQQGLATALASWAGIPAGSPGSGCGVRPILLHAAA